MNGPSDNLFQAVGTPAFWLSSAQIGTVISVEDPQNQGRIQVQLVALDPDEDAPQWARVATGFAGNNYGMFCIPAVGEEVLVIFVGGDASYPVVVGALWNGAHSVPESFSGSNVDRWTICGRAGTRIALVEEGESQEKVVIETPAGAHVTVSDESGGKIVAEVGGKSITMDSGGLALVSDGQVTVDASSMTLTAGTVTVNAGTSTFSGSIICSSVTTPSVSSGTYTPGAGNIW